MLVRTLTLSVLLAVAALALASERRQTPPPPTPPRFTDVERADVLRRWREEVEVQVSNPDTADRVGLWHVRLTVPGSQWLWNYDRARGLRVPPTQIAPAQNPEQQIWETWIDAKVAYDRWQAQREADGKNQTDLGRTFPPDATVPTADPADPGPPPAGLVTIAGNPPPFAAAVKPTQHRFRFADGTEIRYQTHVRMRPRYAFYRFETGVISGGRPVRDLPITELERLFRAAGVGPSESRVMRAVSLLEGGFDSVNTYDTGWVSIGFIQFASLSGGAGALGELLRGYRLLDLEGFSRDFRDWGLDVTEDGRLVALNLETGEERTGPDAAREIVQDPRLVAVFQRAGRVSPRWNEMQIRSAFAQFWPGNDPVSITLPDGTRISGRVRDFIRSEAGLATLMDRKVNTGRLDPLPTVLVQAVQSGRVRRLEDLVDLERAIVERLRYRKDYLQDATLSQPAVTGRTLGPSPSRSGKRGGRKGG